MWLHSKTQDATLPTLDWISCFVQLDDKTAGIQAISAGCIPELKFKGEILHFIEVFRINFDT